MHSIQQILDAKGRDVFSVAPDDSVFEAIRLMAERGVGALLVLDGERLAGVISERDYARKVILRGKSSRETPVRDIMTAEVVTTAADRSLDACLGLMTKRRIRHLPVVDGEAVVGVLSIGDLVKAKIEDQQAQIENLESYITGH